VGERFGRIRDRWPDLDLGFHVHNMNGLAPATILCALDAGVDWFETSICGIGGGVATPTATGNFPTEDIVRMFEDCGVRTGLDADAVMQAARSIANRLQIPVDSAAGRHGSRAEMKGKA
jgi:hydroxymethylglutaryl-CoA lyase